MLSVVYAECYILYCNVVKPSVVMPGVVMPGVITSGVVTPGVITSGVVTLRVAAPFRRLPSRDGKSCSESSTDGPFMISRSISRMF